MLLIKEINNTTHTFARTILGALEECLSMASTNLLRRSFHLCTQFADEHNYQTPSFLIWDKIHQKFADPKDVMWLFCATHFPMPKLTSELVRHAHLRIVFVPAKPNTSDEHKKLVVDKRVQYAVLMLPCHARWIKLCQMAGLIVLEGQLDWAMCHVLQASMMDAQVCLCRQLGFMDVGCHVPHHDDIYRPMLGKLVIPRGGEPVDTDKINITSNISVLDTDNMNAHINVTMIASSRHAATKSQN
ncbi:hypothetical protein L210DRAFT_933749 [Boletus edulis BED1]|uniref:Uncharacterized protein n=1 Tax=Boletus edulis BED1 TaxID=1328754 RepID=A0AAD4C8Z6_BOLED|nr:hypothetical protein L210DRAFT_933749 [Boletus edulis BED1]